MCMRQVTVGSVLALDIFKNTPPQLISQPEVSAWDEPVRWMHILETARPEGLLPGGEFILTTATFLDPVVDSADGGLDAANQFLDSVEATGAVAVVAEVLPDRQKVITALKAAARDRVTPIYLIYDLIRFVELTQFVHENLAAARLQEVETDRRIHEAFTRLSVGSASTSRIVAEAAALLECPVEWESIDKRSAQKFAAAHSVVAGDEELGRLIIREACSAEDKLVRTVLERAGQAVAISVLAQRSQREMRRSTASSLFYQLRGGTELSAQEVQWRLSETFGYAPVTAAKWVPVVFRISGPQQTEERLNRWSGVLLDILEQLGSVQQLPVFAARSEIGVVDMLVPAREATELHELIETTHARFSSRLSGRSTLVAGIAGETESAKASAEQLEDAARIAYAAEAYVAVTHRNQAYFYAQDLGLPGLLATLNTHEHFTAFVTAELASLAGGARTRGALEQQLDFIEALVTSTNKAELARMLHISRPALYARLKNLEVQLGYNLEQHAERRTAIHLALLAYRQAPDQIYPLLVEASTSER
ncbi:PucR family transcriptional regulator [Enteractinococcus fodinae]